MARSHFIPVAATLTNTPFFVPDTYVVKVLPQPVYRENGTENGTLLEKFDFSDPIPARLPSYTEAPGE
jgi:hypothetical protein